MSAPLDEIERCGDLALACALAGGLFVYPDAEQVDRMTALRAAPRLDEALRGTGLADALASLLSALTGAEADDLRSEHIARFDRSPQSPLYEGEYGAVRSVSKVQLLADLCGFYGAFGFALEAESGQETADHLSVELEFLALLLVKEAALRAADDTEGVEIVQGARRLFLADHLGGFVRGLCSRPEVAEPSPWAPAARLALHLVDTLCAELGIDPPAAVSRDLAKASASEPEDMRCGDCVPLH